MWTTEIKKKCILLFETALTHCSTAHLHKVKLFSTLLQQPTVAVFHVPEDRRLALRTNDLRLPCHCKAYIGLKHLLALMETLKHFSKHIKREYQGQRISRAIPHVDWTDQFHGIRWRWWFAGKSIYVAWRCLTHRWRHKTFVLHIWWLVQHICRNISSTKASMHTHSCLFILCSHLVQSCVLLRSN